MRGLTSLITSIFITIRFNYSKRNINNFVSVRSFNHSFHSLCLAMLCYALHPNPSQKLNSSNNVYSKHLYFNLNIQSFIIAFPFKIVQLIQHLITNSYLFDSLIIIKMVKTSL